MYPQSPWLHRLSALVGAAVMVGIVIAAGNLLGMVVGTIFALPGGTDQYAFAGGISAAAVVAATWAAVAGYRLIARALVPNRGSIGYDVPTGAIRNVGGRSE